MGGIPLLECLFISCAHRFVYVIAGDAFAHGLPVDDDTRLSFAVATTLLGAWVHWGTWGWVLDLVLGFKPNRG